MKYLLWQFSAYAAVAVALGVVVGRWTMAGRLSSAERERQRAAFELSTLTLKASSLLEESGRERSSLVDANGRLAEELRLARELHTRIEADLRASELNRSQAESSLRAASERFVEDQASTSAKPHPSTGSADRDSDRDPVDRADFERVADELRLARTELSRVTQESSLALAVAEARAKAAESAHLELSRVHAASVRAAQVELTRAVVRAERAETVLSVRPARRAIRVAEDRIVDLRPFDRVPEPTADGMSE